MERQSEIFIIIFSLIVFLLNLRVALISPISFGDEGFHSFMANYIAKKLEYPAYVKEIGGESYLTFERPPFWNIFEASFIFLFRFIDDSLIIKFLTPFLVFLLGTFTYYLAKRAFNENIALITAIITITIPSIATYSVLFYTDILATFFYSLFLFLFLIGYKENNKKFLILSSVFAGLSFLTKINSIVLFAFYPLAFLIKRKDFPTYLQCFIILTLVTSGYFIRNFIEYKTPLCREIPIIGKYFLNLDKCQYNVYKSKFGFEGRVEEVGTEVSVFRMGLNQYLQFAYGNFGVLPYYLPFFIFFAGFLFLIKRKEKYSAEIILLNLLFFLMIFFSSTSRAEDTARYTLIFVPALAIIPAIFIDEFLEKCRNKHFLFSLFVASLIVIYLTKNTLTTIIGTISVIIITVSILYRKNKTFFSIISSIASVLIISIVFLTSTSLTHYLISFVTLSFFTMLLIGINLKEKSTEKIMMLTIVYVISVISFLNFSDKNTIMESVKRFSDLFFEACDWVKHNLPENARLMTIWSYRAIYNCERSVAGNIADISVARDLNTSLKTIKETGVTHIFIQKFSIGNRDLIESQHMDFVKFLESHPNYFKKIFENPVNDTCFENCLNGVYLDIYGRCPCDGNIIYEVDLTNFIS
ncbi:MAG: glycosyltransferase family 39 protein [Candidatus Aenigmarchaeota archaeon]|nr:glycosyltransferase family 39 protein [Candidatus Aenigmarchaeota archaeon]MDW8149398.1 glycosyltransferase family 39 protein [Candidatus Aenigmarchaeota archaeon]